MSVGKIVFGVLLILISIVIWSSIMGDSLKAFIDNPGEREEFREKFRSLQPIYFLLTIGGGVGIIVWGTQT